MQCIIRGKKPNQLTNCDETKNRALNTQTVRDKKKTPPVEQRWALPQTHISNILYIFLLFMCILFVLVLLSFTLDDLGWSLINDCCISASCSQLFSRDLVPDRYSGV